jgi:hypothetical protein
MHHWLQHCAAPVAPPRGAPPRRTTTLLLTGACGLSLALAGMAFAASAVNEVTGTVQKVDKVSGRVVIAGQTFVMKASGPLALVPQVGHKVSLFFDERNGENVITRIGQAHRLSARTADLEASQ